MALAKQILFHLTLIASLSAQPARFGLPACDTSDNEFADRTWFVLCHSASRKVPTWVGYELKPEHLSGTAHRRFHFRRDAALQHEGARDSDYRGSGYSRGHLAPAADFAWSEDAVHATFLLSNAAPQVQSTNAGPWLRLERTVRRLAIAADAVYVFTGPIFEGAVSFIGEGKVAVPTHFFKVVLVEKGPTRQMFAAIVPNSPTATESLPHFLTTVDQVEQLTGLNFFPTLHPSEQAALESTPNSLPN